MLHATFVMRDGVLVDKRRAAPLVTRLPLAPGICAPGLIRDSMDPIVHPCTGKPMDSKAVFRAVTRAHGCEEIGSESPVIAPSYVEERAYSDGLKRDIARAMDASEHAPAACMSNEMAEAVASGTADGWV